MRCLIVSQFFLKYLMNTEYMINQWHVACNTKLIISSQIIWIFWNQMFPFFKCYFLLLCDQAGGINLKFTRKTRHSQCNSEGIIWITGRHIIFYQLMDILRLVSTFQTTWIDTSLLNCEVEAVSQLHTQNSCVFTRVCWQNILTSVIAGHMLCDCPPCFRSAHKGLDANGWTCATSGNPHHVSLLLQIRGTALDEGPTAFRPQVCPDCLQRHYGCLQHLVCKRSKFVALPLSLRSNIFYLLLSLI